MILRSFTKLRKRAILFIFALVANLAFGQASIYTTPYTVDPAKDPGFNTASYESWTYQRTVSGAIQRLPFRMLKPVGYNRFLKPYPLIIMLHGRGERGTDNNFQLKWGGLIHQNAVQSGQFPGFVVFPQEPYGAWTNSSTFGPTQPSTALSQVFDLVDSLLLKYNIDPDRVYVHGLSSGGTGTWACLYHRPDLFAAALPMCGPGDVTQVSKIAVTPIWMFQGEIDTNPTKEVALNMYNALVAEGAKNTAKTKYTEYAGVGHFVWTPAYAEPNFFPYMLAQNKKNIMVLGNNPLPWFGGSVSLGIASGMGAYQWYRNDVAIVGATGYRLNGVTSTGTYTVRFKRKPSSAVWVTSNPVTVSRKLLVFLPLLTLRTEEVEATEEISAVEELSDAFGIYPNPTSGLVNINLPSEATGVKFTVVNQLGTVVFEQELNHSRSQVDLTGLEKGIYIANISVGDRKDNIKLTIE